jgi:hypothetical protein
LIGIATEADAVIGLRYRLGHFLVEGRGRADVCRRYAALKALHDGLTE